MYLPFAIMVENTRGVFLNIHTYMYVYVFRKKHMCHGGPFRELAGCRAGADRAPAIENSPGFWIKHRFSQLLRGN